MMGAGKQVGLLIECEVDLVARGNVGSLDNINLLNTNLTVPFQVRLLSLG